MNKDRKHLIPDLRFPEFVNDGDWELKKLKDVATYENGKAHEQGIDENGKFVVVNSKFISSNATIRKFTNSANCLAKSEETLMVLSDLPNGKALGKCFFVDKDDFYTVNQRICKITPRKIDSKILFYLLNRNPYFLSFDDGVKQTNLRNEDVLNFEILLPSKLYEQQKIASCLSSLDQLISAQKEKLELLKNHKKGLMQNLFPQEGETVPKFRFPEFENDGDWIYSTVNNLVGEKILFSPQDGNHGNIHPKSSDYVSEGIPFIMASNLRNGEVNIISCSYLKAEHADSLQKGFSIEGDVLLSHKGTVGEVAIVRKLVTPYIMLTPQVTYYRIRDKEKMSNSFLASYFKSSYYQRSLIKISGGGTRAYVGITEQGKLKVYFPKSISEQEKIAFCFSSLDDLISSQALKIEKLQLHKKGLMQGLFPKVID